MSRLEICYSTCRIATQTVAPTITGFQGIKSCVKYLDSHPHKPIFFPSNSYDGLNVIRITWSGNQVEYYTTSIFLECHQYAYHARILNIRRSVSGIIHNLLGVSIFWEVNIQPYISSESTGGEMRCMYKAVKKNKAIQSYTKPLKIHTGAPTVHREDITNCIYVVEAKIVTTRVKKIGIPVCFLQEQFDNGPFIPKYDKSSVIPADIFGPNHVQVQLSAGVLNL